MLADLFILLRSSVDLGEAATYQRLVLRTGLHLLLLLEEFAGKELLVQLSEMVVFSSLFFDSLRVPAADHSLQRVLKRSEARELVG